MRIPRVVPLVLLLLPLAAAGQPVEGLSTTPAVPQEFLDHVNQYAEMHRVVTAGLGPPRIYSDPEQVLSQTRAYANALRNRRARAQEGDTFTPDAEAAFRILIAAAIRDTGLCVTVEPEDVQDELVDLSINGALPWRAGPAMCPSILWRLPELPVELEDPFVGRDLVLVDTFGGIVVDVLRDALPATGTEDTVSST